MAEQASTYLIEVDGIDILVRRKRVKRYNIHVTKDGVEMSVPLAATEDQVRGVAHQNSSWMREQLLKVGLSPKRAKRMEDTVGSTFTVEVAGLTVEVTRKKVKNYNMRISPEGKPVMSVPLGTNKTDAERMVAMHAEWYREALDNYEGRIAERARAYETGEQMLLWGEPVTLKVTEGPYEVERVGDTLELRLRKEDRDNVELRQILVENYLGGILKERVDELLTPCAIRVGAAPTKVTLRRMKSRWGSCTKGNGRIRLNVALASCPPECTEAVLCHELCHLLEANHGERFYARLDLAYPNWRHAQAWLDAHHPSAL